MSVTTITNAVSSVDSSKDSTTGVGDLGFDTFITLLVTQMQNQDPLNPMDGTEFTAQLATFSQLEQSMQTNEYLDAISTANDYSTISLAVSYVGKEVLSPFGNEGDIMTIELPEDGSMGFVYNLEEDAYSTEIDIYDTEGTLITTLSGGTDGGLNIMTWDGTNADGEHVEAGQYQIEVHATSPEGEDVTHQFYAYSEVLGVAGEEGELVLSLANGEDVSFEDVVQVRVAN